MRYAPSRLVVLTALLALAIIAVPALLSGPVFADPGSGGDPTATPLPTTTPYGDVIAKPVTLDPVTPKPMVKAKSFTRHLYILRETKRLQRGIEQNLNDAEKWALVRGVYIRFGDSRHLAVSGLQALRQQFREALQQKNRQQRISQHPPQLSDWLCIHHYEGAWNDHGGPYWGGLQMSLDFQQTYAPRLYRTRGTADHWTPLEQIWAAVRAARTRGFWPWPNTARECGLL